MTSADGILSNWIFSPLDVREFFTSPTLLAIRSFMAVLLTSASVSPIYAALGIIRWDGVDATPPADPPGPLTHANLDWIQRWVGTFPAGTTGPSMGNPNVFDLTHLSKAKRKLENTSGLLLCWEVDDVIGTGLLSFTSDHRYLIQQV